MKHDRNVPAGAQRAYALIEVKSFDEEKRILRGIATTPSVDRAGDVVEPKGAEFALPIPFLWQHNAHEPIGHVTKATVTRSGIDVEVQLARTDEPGTLKDRLDEAWQSIKLGLVRGLSIGFAGTEVARTDTGYKFLKWLWLELSAVTIAANGDCSIQTIKSIDTAARAASGTEAASVAKAITPAASGISVTHARRKPMARKSYAERIAAFDETLKAKRAEMVEIMDEAEGEGRTLTAEEKDAYDALEGEVAEVREHLKRLSVLQADEAKTATPVGDVRDVKTAAEVRGGVAAQAKAPKPEPGIQFARYARCMILGKKTGVSAIDIARQEYGERDPHIVDMVTKANISAVNSTTDSALFGNEGGVADYVEYLRNQTIVGRFGQNGIPALRRVPFYFPVVTQATGSTAYWTAEGAGKPMTKPTWSRTELTPLTIAGLAAVTIQALRFSSPSAEAALRDDLTAAVVEAIDTAFIDPANSGTAGAKPASISNGISGTTISSGNDADAIRADARAAMAVFVAAKNPLTSGVWIMSGSTALGILMLNNALGQPEFNGITANGGMFMGLPVIVSEAAGNTVTLVNAGDIWLADDGGVQVDTSDSASLQMMDASVTGTSTGSDPVETTLVSMFQTNSVAIRVEKFINWARRRPTGVATITSVDWGQDAAATS